MKTQHPGTPLRVLLQIGASLALLAFLLSKVDWQRSLALIRGAEPLLLAAVVAIQMADRVLMALKWHQLLRLLDERLSRWSAIRVYYESTFIGFVLPLGGLGPDIVRFMRLRHRGIDSHITLSSMVMERINGVIATLTFVAVGLACLAGLASHASLRRFAVIGALCAAIAGIAAAGFIFLPRVSRRLFQVKRIRALLASARFAKYAEAARIYSRQPATVAINLGLSMLEQTVPMFVLWVGSHALGTALPLLVCLAVAPAAVIIQRLPLTYAGLGLREGSGAAVLVALGYDYSAALVLFLVIFVMFLIALVPGAFFLATNRSQVTSYGTRA